MNVIGMPVIFDLPTPLAIKRKNEFFRYVHPVLQHYCVKCHDGHYDGHFSLSRSEPGRRRPRRSGRTWMRSCGLSTPRTRRRANCSPAPGPHRRGVSAEVDFSGLERLDLSDPCDLGSEPEEPQAGRDSAGTGDPGWVRE